MAQRRVIFISYVRTVTGDIPSSQLGITLPHEHILTGFNEQGVQPGDYDVAQVVSKMLPYLQELYAAGARCLIECTPPFMGRDLVLLRKLSQASGLLLIGATGAYKVPYLADAIHTDSEEAIAARWIDEIEHGVDGIYPGFIKIAMEGTTPTEMERKVLRCAILASQATGLVIGVHCPGPALWTAVCDLMPTAFPLERMIWIHGESAYWSGVEGKQGVLAAQRAGMWIEVDCIRPETYDIVQPLLTQLWTPGARLLISQDAGWYMVGEPERQVIAYAPLLTDFVPRLPGQMARELTTVNPGQAFRVRTLV